MSKITVIGTGNVGATIAYTLVISGLATEIVMIDINEEKSLGEALDIRQGIPFCAPCTIHAGTYSDAVDSDIVIFTSGVARKPGQSRLDLAQTNVNITKSIIPQITKYAPNAHYLIVSNPVDILTYTFCKCSDIPENRIIGSGTLLDTARLRTRLSEYYNINQKNVHAYVFGEHGDTSFVPWSLANISNVPVQECHNIMTSNGVAYPELNYDEVEEYVRKSGAKVIQRKGATFFAVSASVVHLCKCLLGGLDTITTVSTMMHGEYGIDDVCLSILSTVGRNGVQSKMLAPLTDGEIELLHKSADTLKGLISSLDI